MKIDYEQIGKHTDRNVNQKNIPDGSAAQSNHAKQNAHHDGADDFALRFVDVHQTGGNGFDENGIYCSKTIF